MPKKLYLLLFALLATPAMAYVVQTGDTLGEIAREMNSTVQQVADYNQISNPNLIFPGQIINEPEGKLGGYNPVTGYQSRLTSYVSASATSIPVASMKDPSGVRISLADISNAGVVKVYFNLEAGSTKEEAIMCTGMTTSSWTGCVRGLRFQGSAESSSSTLRKAHNAGASIVMTNIAQFYNQYVPIEGNATINDSKTFSGVANFSVLPRAVTSTPTHPQELITLDYLSGWSFGGVNASDVVKGVVEEATVDQIGAGTATGETGARLFIPVSATANDGGNAYTIPHADYTGKLSNTWINTTTFTALIASTTPTAGMIPIANASGTLNNAWLIHKFGGTGADGAFSTTTAAVMDLGGKSVFEKNYTSISITGSGSLSFTNPNANGTTIIFKSTGNVTLTSSAAPMIDASGLGAAGGNGGPSGGTGAHYGTGGQDGYAGFITSKGGDNNNGTTPSTPFINAKLLSLTFYKYPGIFVGGGGGGGGTFYTDPGGAPGGRGGGALIIECGGAWSFTTAQGISVAGKNGGAGSSGSSSGGGGGGGGYFLGVYNTLISNSGTVSSTAGAFGGNGGYPGGGGGSGVSAGTGSAGAPGFATTSLNTEFY
jgi:LysM repeat protein